MQQYFSILKTKYDQSTFQKFAHELLNDIEIGSQKLPIDSPFKDHIDSLTYLGSYADPQGKNLHILDVSLKTHTKLEQARTMQRNLIARYLKDHWLDSALVSFHNDSSSSWRLSFVKVEYKYDEKGKPKEEATPAKRYSFLVGEGEPVHTPQSQLAKIFEQTVTNPTLAQLEEAFGVEKVTKEFFEKYRDLFESVVAELKSNHTFINEASRNNIDTENFAKKLLGQIVFLYFLQKKGWLGVPRGKSWGEGDKNFMSGLYKKCIQNNQNFYNDYLEKLFYDTLNNPRRNEVDPSYSKYFDSRIPFLNGGLFEAPYDWNNSFIYLDNKIFGKVFDVFDLYNFTVKEDEPLEKEVAVDPEMLGKVFENLLEENLRKGKGTYYTPREIVHYMCEESLINHLATETGLTPEDVKNKYFPTYNVLGDEKFEARDVTVSESIINSLENIKVVDPACGSGAFLVGMLQQITHLRYELESRSKLLGRRDTASTEYEIKKQTIQNCIYGVDIDPGAVEIAKLRLWLSLVVDYDLEQIEPLPNLDYKIMQGNSLLEELVLGDTSIKLYDSESVQKALGSKRMKNLFDQESQIGLFDGENDKVLKAMKALQLKYFSTSDSEGKKKLRSQIEQIEHELIETSVKSSLHELQSQKLNIRTLPGIGILPEDFKRLEKISSKENQIFAVLDELKKTGTKPFFLWHLYFADVFEEKGGFDVVIANPPYVFTRGSDFTDTFKKAIGKLYSCGKGKINLFSLFIERASHISKPMGIYIYIIPNTFFRATSYKTTREYVVKNNKILQIIDLHAGVFENVTASTTVLEAQNFRQPNKEVEIIEEFSQLINHSYSSRVINQEEFNNNEFVFSIYLDSTSNKIINIIKHDSTNLGTFCKDIIEGIVTPKGKNTFISTEEKAPNYKPFLEGKDIDRYQILWQNKFILFDRKKLHRPRPDYLWNAPNKILIRRIGGGKNAIVATLDQNSFYTYASINNLLLKDDCALNYNYILSLLNSRLLNWYYIENFTNRSTLTVNISKTYLEVLPIKEISLEMQKPFIILVNKILEITKSNNDKNNETLSKLINKYSEDIDKLVYELYGLTLEEIKIVESI
ncbi:MAG: hypothetical protein US62_C0003G0013 [Candidatus Woesebacteria bacterium GW2011_GWA1_37_8]|uniref:site-specific DNA-methyltransferase (adenine-specific) n=2 Tax=Candidatus Woeseibacteriota TaxID=1752722 RepID=A0A0G0NPG3_9BACT|nr:MAG: hypothetical protein US39_C0010G0012 [Microgenomates group bacterium GW2011_GWC1_37_12b]KKQ46264.1 MAG: hypothetical protein US62_C0003G0013 [Candidatus Woesebacteria bacterium GW2011_GWA1_37_8]KKQ87774.1 MAG: hypothetical protein UT10_C0001G0015 [Candidatus Woesebacteria bacterium GW2011_GWB1_38_8b]